MQFARLNQRHFSPQLAAFLAVFLLAQSTALVHLDLDDAHATDDICALCVGLSNLGAGNVGLSLDLAAWIQSEPPPEFLDFHAGVHRLDHRFARGPPQTS